MSASTHFSGVELRTLDPDVAAMMATAPPPPVKIARGALSKWFPLVVQWKQSGHGSTAVFRHLKQEEERLGKRLLPPTATERRFVRAMSQAAAKHGLKLKKGGQGA